MPSVETIKVVHHGWTKFPAKDFFVGPQEAHIRLAYGSKQEYEFDVNKHKQREREANERRQVRRARRVNKTSKTRSKNSISLRSPITESEDNCLLSLVCVTVQRMSLPAVSSQFY